MNDRIDRYLSKEQMFKERYQGQTKTYKKYEEYKRNCNNIKQFLFKTKMCRSVFSNYKCAFGEKCHFAHSRSELLNVKLI